MEKKEKILKGCKSIPINSLVNYVKNGEVTFQELISAGLSKEKADNIVTAMQKEDNDQWNAAQQKNTPESYNEYLVKFPSGIYANNARQALQKQDDALWMNVKNSADDITLNSYKQQFPNGKHIRECEELISDLPWRKAKQTNTIMAYSDYMRQYPGKHDIEAKTAIIQLSDDNDWQITTNSRSSQAYRNYLNQHPNGKYIQEARKRLQASASRDAFLDKIRKNKNAYKADDIKEEIKSGTADWSDIAEIFGEDEKDAIKNFVKPSDLPRHTPPEALIGNTAEVYFWGTPSSGKTCALGAIISNAKNNGIFSPEQCPGYDYMTRLSNIFKRQGICTLPSNSDISSVHEMVMGLRDKEKKTHMVTLIDLAGELFKTVYFKQNNISVGAEKEDTLNKVMGYLSNTKNKKIHFFVIEYGAHNNEWDGLKMENYLDSMRVYLESHEVIKKSTDGIYVLVTKCDIMDCEREERAENAFNYVKKEFPSFWNTLCDICINVGISQPMVLSFSIGEVFAQNLCKFDPQDTDKVIDKLLRKTYAKSRGWLTTILKS